MLTTYHLLKLSLTLHIAGITMTAGTMLMNYVIYLKFWKTYFSDKQKAGIILSAASKFPVVAGIGMGILLLSGIAMMVLTRGAYMHQRWFMLKLGVIVLLLVNGLVVMRRLVLRLHRLLQADSESGAQGNPVPIQKGLNASVVLQLALFLVIFVLATFRFN
jgi:hypothetical protein